MCVATLLSIALLQSIEGLGPSEAFVPAPTFERPELEDARTGRVLDATTGRPLEGVLVESWTEDWELPGLLVDAQTSRRDGTYHILARREGRHADKLRLTRDGYRSTVRAWGEVYVDILLVPGRANAELVLQNLRGEPIAGAKVTTRQTCAHGPSAIEAFSDAHGRVDLSLLPPLDDSPELEVTADGFGALRNRDAGDVLAVAGETPTWLLGRKRPLRFRLLDPEGRPAANTRVLAGYAPEWSFTHTDAEGRAEFGFAFQDQNLLLHAPLSPGRDDSLLDFAGWDCGELLLRQDGDVRNRTWAETDPIVRIEVARPGLPFVLLHEQGWRSDSNGVHRFPPGNARLLVGAPFTGFVERSQTLELKSGTTTTLVVDAQPEPELSIGAIAGPDGEPMWVELVLEAAGQSLSIDHNQSTSYSVPPGVPVTVALPFVRRPFSVVLMPEELSKPLVIEELAGWKSQPLERELETLEIDVPIELAGLLRVDPHARGTRGGSISPGEVGWPIQVERGVAVELALRAEGYVERTVVLPSLTPRPPIIAQLVPCASLEIEGERVREVIGLHDAPERDEHGVFVLRDVAPGPLVLHVDVDGTWHSLSLELEPGARRKLTLR
ncbi:MAG: carboxypeptidase regulatory-like domain-containing protein [Planctomycetes bacterium]|nr:carboxypeptidase regulatory-like domain-containing protein [Planctomycetota bacterium]